MNSEALRALACVPLRPGDTPHTIACRIWVAIEDARPGLDRDRDRQRLALYTRAAEHLQRQHRVTITPETITDPTAADHLPVENRSHGIEFTTLLALVILGTVALLLLL